MPTANYYIKYRKWYWPLWRFVLDYPTGTPKIYTHFSYAIRDINYRINNKKPAKKHLKTEKKY